MDAMGKPFPGVAAGVEVRSNHCLKCYLCDHDFTEGEESWLIFEKRPQANGQFDGALSGIIASALGRVVTEETAHSTLLCNECNSILQEYRSIEQLYYEMRFQILTEYNKTAKLNGLPTIPIEINGILQEDDVPELDIVQFQETDETLVQQLNLMSKQDGFVEQVPLGNELVINSLDDLALPKSAGDSNCQFDLLISSDLKDGGFEPVYDIENTVNEIMENTQIDTEDLKHEGFEPLYDVENTVNENIENMPMDKEDIMYYIIEHNSVVSNEDDVSADSQCIELFNYSSCNNDDLGSADDVIGNTDENDNNAEVESTLQTKSQPTSRLTRKLRDTQPPMYKHEDNIYTCLLCATKEEYSPKSFAEHMRSQHNYRFYTCDVCGSGFFRRQDLNDHMEQQKHGNFECETCQRVFENYSLLRMHKRVHYTNAKQFECTECHKRYSSKNLLDGHMNMHTGQRPYKCAQCPKDFASKYTLQAHVKIHSDRERPYQCDQCDKAFLNHQNLAQHRKLHSGIKSFKCEVCSKAFGTQHNLYVHLIVHSGNKPFICRTCGKAFARRAEIKDHERIHTGERPFKCDLCHLAFAQRSNLTSHKKSTHFNEKLHKCQHCDRSFKRRRLLDYHIQSTHTGERPHKCDVCGASFVYPEHHKKHMLIHLGVKPYSCEVCGKLFNSRDNRNAHRFIHSNKKPYECLECGAGFMRKPLLLTHMKRTNHSNDTIIVNQPQIDVCDTLDDEPLLAEEKVDEGAESQYKAEDAMDDEMVESYMMQRGENMLTVVDNDVGDDSHDTIASVGQLIKDEIGDVRYLQFEELDGDGHQTWVDISDKSS